jgi:hypothetical protein
MEVKRGMIAPVASPITLVATLENEFCFLSRLRC